MPQAISPPTLSRRRLLRAGAGVSLAIVAPAAVASVPALENPLLYSMTEFEDAAEKLRPHDRASLLALYDRLTPDRKKWVRIMIGNLAVGGLA